MGISNGLMFGDSTLIIKAMQNLIKNQEDSSIKLMYRIKTLASNFSKLCFYHILRDLNGRLDHLANEGGRMESGTLKILPSREKFEHLPWMNSWIRPQRSFVERGFKLGDFLCSLTPQHSSPATEGGQRWQLWRRRKLVELWMSCFFAFWMYCKALLILGIYYRIYSTSSFSLSRSSKGHYHQADYAAIFYYLCKPKAIIAYFESFYRARQ